MRASLVLIFIGGSLASCFRPVSEPDSGPAADSGIAPSSDAGDSCGYHLVWRDDRCVAVDCTQSADSVSCLLPDGGFGFCFSERCQTTDFGSPDNCGGWGHTCPQGDHCESGFCADDQGNIARCSSSSCSRGEICLDRNLGAYCVVATCTEEWLGRPCLLSPSDTVNLGACCGTSCEALETNDHCGGCGVVCGAGEFCEF